MIVGLQGLSHLEPKQSWSFCLSQKHRDILKCASKVWGFIWTQTVFQRKNKVEKAQLLLGVISPKEPATIGMIPKLAVGHVIKKTAAPQRLATEMTLARPETCRRTQVTLHHFFCFSNLRIDSRAASQLSFMAFRTTCQVYQEIKKT